MAGFGQTIEQGMLEYIFKRTAFAAAPTTLFVSLHSADPGDTGASELAATGSYVRAQLDPDTNNSTNTNWNAVDEPATAKRITNKLDITFATATAAWNGGSSIGFWGLWSASSAGTYFLGGTITGGIVVNNGNTAKFTGGTPGQLSFTVD